MGREVARMLTKFNEHHWNDHGSKLGSLVVLFCFKSRSERLMSVLLRCFGQGPAARANGIG